MLEGDYVAQEVILEVKNLNVRYKTLKGNVRAVNDVSFKLNRGEVLGLAGESGCGKTTLGLTIMNILPSNGWVEGGEVLFKGRNIVNLSEDEMRKIRWKEISMVFQGAMNALNPVIKVGDQVAEALMLHENMSKEEALEVVRDIFIQVGLETGRVNAYPHQLSGGMKQRVVIAMALVLRPSLVIADEPTTALDVTIQAQILDLLRKLQKRFGLSYIYITHDLAVLAEIANKVAIMYAGYMVEFGDVVSIYKDPIHPYTKGLIGSIPSISQIRKRKRLFSIPGAPPDLRALPPGCPFAPRCPLAKDICRKELPEPCTVNHRVVRCHFAEDLVGVPPEDVWLKIMEGVA